MKNYTIISNQQGFIRVPLIENSYMVQLSGKFISGNLNETQTGAKVMHFYRGNASGSVPFKFKSLDLALDGFKQVRWVKGPRIETARVFSGNLWVGNIVNDVYEPLEKQILQLL